MEAASVLASLDERAQSELARWTVPGMVLGLLAGGQTAVRAYGVADLESGRPVESGTPFRICSITKPVHATLALGLEQDGLLDLDRSLDDYRLPHQGTTLRHLLSHRAALAFEWPTPIGTYGDLDDCLERLAADSPTPLPYEPGDFYSYSNAGFSLAGAVTSRAAGSTFEQALQSRVLDPLGMTATAFEETADAAVGHVQVEPGADEHRPARLPYPRGRRPSGGLYSTAADLLRFAAHQLGGPGPLSAEARAAMREPLAPTSDGHYGVGFFLRSAGGRPIVEHPGSIAGFRTLFLLSPDEDLAFVAMTNSGRGHCVVRGLLDELGLGREQPPLVDVDPGPLGGEYRQGATSVSVSSENGGVRIQVVDTDPISGERRPLVPLLARPTGAKTFVVVGGEENGTRIELVSRDLLRIGLRILVRERR